MTKSKLKISRAFALSENDILLATVSEDWEAFEPASRIYRYKHADSTKPWGHVELDMHTQKICEFSESSDSSYYVIASSEGHVFHSHPAGPYMERILGAGIDQEDSKSYGRIYGINQIGNKLYACGSGGQLYVRQGRDKWELLTDSILWDTKAYSKRFEAAPPKDSPTYESWIKKTDAKHDEDNPNILLNAINGTSESDIYICGEQGYLFHWDGNELENLDLGIEEALTDIYINEDNDIWICGRDGALLNGSEEEGFDVLTDESETHLFTSITIHKKKVLLASQTDTFGLFQYKNKKEIFKRITPRLKPVLRTIHTIQAIGDVIWLVGTKDILRFDGEVWERIQHPDMPVPQL